MGLQLRSVWLILAFSVLGISPSLAQSRTLPIIAYGSSPQQSAKDLKAGNTSPTPISKNSATLFGKAFYALFGAEVIQLSSKTLLKGTSGGFNFSVPMKHQTIANATGQFRTDIEFVDTAKPGRQYQVISDGKTLWIYRPDRKEYSVQTYQQFDASDDSAMIGLATGLYLSLSDIKQLIPEESPTPQDLQEAGIEDLGQKTAESGKSFQVYGMKDDQTSNANIQLWVNPKTALIEALQLLGKEQDMQVEFQETILQFQKNLPVPPDRFTFKPPAGVKQVPKISIDFE
jgi:outer membrane lipoprotein-sorting protein